MTTLVDRYPGLDNPMTFGDYYASPDRTLTCPNCGKVWELYGSEWETPGTLTSDKVPVVDGVCRSCAWRKGQDDDFGLQVRRTEKVLLVTFVTIDKSNPAEQKNKNYLHYLPIKEQHKSKIRRGVA